MFYAIRIILSIGLLSSFLFGKSQDPNFHIYLCFGQSNMEGQGTIENSDKTVDDRFQVFQAVDCPNLDRTRGNWYTATPPLTRCWTGLSPADYFGRTLVENLPAHIKVGVINVSVGGSRIELFDKDKYKDYTDTYKEDWFQDIITAYEGNPYAYLVDLARSAQQDGVVKGILLHQGESNYGDSQWPAKVKKIYDDLINDLGLEVNKVPLLAGELVHADQNGAVASMNPTINKLPETLPNSYVISSEGCTAKSDNLHFDAAGYRELGKRYGMKMLSLLEYDTEAPLGTDDMQKGYFLSQNYPNPVRGSTSIAFATPAAGRVSIKVYDILGNEVEEIVNQNFPAGEHKVDYNLKNRYKGLYFYTMRAGSFLMTKRMVLE